MHLILSYTSFLHDAFHPESPKCAPDEHGNCPSGFSHNEKGNCFPSGKCPPGFGRYTDDESGKCFHTPKPTPIKIININIILKIIHSGGSHGHSNSGPTHGLSDACYTVMKQAWSGNIHVGQNAEVDKFMAGCLA